MSTLEQARAAIADRGFWSAYAESPSAYGEDGAARGKAAFEAYLGKPFPLDQTGADSWVGGERSPYGFDLGIRYPHRSTEALLAPAPTAMPAWRDATPPGRTATCI